MDPLGDVLYAANTNADLSFGGATVVAIDVLRHARAVECFRRFGSDPGSVGDSSCGTVSCGDAGSVLGSTATIEETESKEAALSQRVADYDAIAACMRFVKQQYAGQRIGLPKLGAGLAGGDWAIIAGLIEQELAGEDVTLVEYRAG